MTNLPTTGFLMGDIKEEKSERLRTTKEVSKKIDKIIKSYNKTHGIKKRSEAIRFAILALETK